MERIDELQSLLSEFQLIRDRIKEEARKWWWLDSGYAPILSITKFIEDKKDIRAIVMTNQDLFSALDILIENIKVLLKAKPKKIKKIHLDRVNKDAENILKVIENIKDADRLISQLETISKFAKVYIDENGEKIRVDKIVEETIKQIIERFKTNPLGWEDEKEFFERVVKNLEKKVLE